MDDDPFWAIALEGSGEQKGQWMAPPEREDVDDLSTRRRKLACGEIEHRWVEAAWNPSDPSLRFRLRTMESGGLGHVGEELWDAALILSAFLCDEEARRPGSCVGGKRILELGAGCGLLGLAAASLGAEQVLCTDYLPEVNENLAFNLELNGPLVMDQPRARALPRRHWPTRR